MDKYLMSSKELYEGGMSIRAIAVLRGTHYETIRRCLHAMGTQMKKPGKKRDGGPAVNGHGYVMISQKLDKGKWVTWAAHRLIMQMYLDRPLEPNEVVHHINGVRTDNRLANLEVVTVDANKRRPRRGRKGSLGSPKDYLTI
jgi:hypothetical protein